MIDIDEYTLLRQDRVAKTAAGKEKRGRGVCIYIKSELIPHVSLLPDICQNDKDSEEMWISLAKPGNKKILLGVIYKPPEGVPKLLLDRLNSVLSQYIGKGNPNGKEIYIIGDFNVDYSRCSKDTTKIKLKDLEVKYNLRQLIKNPTRETKTRKSIIDLLYTSVPKEDIVISGVLDITISDHLPIFMIKKKKRQYHPKKTISIRKTTLYDYNTFACVLTSDSRWGSFWTGEHGINELWDIMVNIITDALDVICPMIRITIRKNQPCWYDGSLNKLINSKNSQYKKARESNEQSEWEKLKVCKKQVRNHINIRKRQFIINKLNENSSDPKQFWKEIQQNLHFGKNKKTSTQFAVKTTDNRVVTGKDSVEPLNDYYVNVGATLASKFTAIWAPPKIPQIVPNIHLMTFRFIGTKEVLALVNGLKENKSSRIDGVNTKYLKDALKILIIEFTHLINLCLDHGIMPKKWSVGTITPVPKVGISHAMSDYRPISVLPSPSKIIERAVYNQIVYHLESHGLLDKRQHGFRKDHSTCSAIFDLCQYFYDNLDKRQCISCVFIDYSKAFDTIDHEILCKKLELYGLSMGVIAWCKDYLTNRQQCVKVDEYVSDHKCISYGVPQGSILGLLFFIIYVNDLLDLFCGEGVHIWERIWEKGPIGNFFTNSIPEKLPF